MKELILFLARFLFGRCKNITVGLFGTCGDSTWRNAYITRFKSVGVPYFNPQFFNREYTKEDAQNEAEHLAFDRVILFPVLAITDGIVSLAEIGQAEAEIMHSWNRHLIIYIEPKVNDSFFDIKPELAKKSNQMRMLIREHLSHLKHPRIHVVESEEEMWEVTSQVLNSL